MDDKIIQSLQQLELSREIGEQLGSSSKEDADVIHELVTHLVTINNRFSLFLHICTALGFNPLDGVIEVDILNNKITSIKHSNVTINIKEALDSPVDLTSATIGAYYNDAHVLIPYAICLSAILKYMNLKKINVSARDAAVIRGLWALENNSEVSTRDLYRILSEEIKPYYSQEFTNGDFASSLNCLETLQTIERREATGILLKETVKIKYR